ncbi:Guanine nucleotide-binding-like protein 1 [Clydaea vesicula]|uniref:Guanine nucleotide-binding protein-like 1 n=1 Tax=Clydaea vesicula TaxID=447962 RepID=A0AAD5Y174_9FUNG|nr:Guanine nucleotide-binding-like protein 1 [Clydaea vesicula]
MRKLAYSGKKKKEQLKEKKLRKSERKNDGDSLSESTIQENFTPAFNINNLEDDLNNLTLKDKKSVSELDSKFNSISKEKVEEEKSRARLPFERLPSSALKIGYEDLYENNNFIDIPKRGHWTELDTKETLEQREQEKFDAWLQNVYSKFNAQSLSWFEENLNVWRQLWRVVEISEIILYVVDIRHPIVDLVERKVVEEWEQYFKLKFPNLTFATFSYYPEEAFYIRNELNKKFTRKETKVKYKRYQKAYGVIQLLKACKNTKAVKNGIVVDFNELIKLIDSNIKKMETLLETKKKSEVSKSDRKREKNELRSSFKNVDIKIKDLDQDNYLSDTKEKNVHNFKDDEDSDEFDSSTDEEDSYYMNVHAVEEPHANSSGLEEYSQIQLVANKDMLTIGLIGHPNVGKSSLINSIVGKKVVSTSRTPGHTKHFQTINLNSFIRVCDCPGLVFPSIIPKPLQILSGMYKIAQVKEPYSSVQYLAERINLEKALGLLNQNDNDKSNVEWSAWKICEEFALKKGFLTSKSGRPDTYRAANLILRLCCDGKILLCFRPNFLK